MDAERRVCFCTVIFIWFTSLTTVKVGNFDHLITFMIVLKLFPNTFLKIFLHENVRVL
jgi:hypothetical protein